MNLLEQLEKISNKDRSLCPYEIDKGSALLINDYDIYKDIFLINHHKFRKYGMPDWRAVSNILTEEGKAILGIKPIRGKTFQSSYKPSIAKCLIHVNKSLKKKLDTQQGVKLDFSNFIRETLLVYFSKTLFAIQIEEYAENFTAATKFIEWFKIIRQTTSLNMNKILQDKHSNKYKESRKIHLKVANCILQKLLDGNMDLTTDTTELQEAIISVLLASCEPVANSLCWTIYLLETHMKQKKLLLDNLSKFDESSHNYYSNKLLRFIIHESLRMYPPAWIITREAIEEHHVFGQIIPENTFVSVSPYIMHKDIRYWEKADIFNPTRFSDKKNSSNGFCPFGGGPRQCPSSMFAKKLMSGIIGLLYKNFNLTLLNKKEIEPMPLISLRPHPGMILQAEYRYQQ